MNVESPGRASLLALLVARTFARPVAGTFEIVCGASRTYLAGDTVTDTRPDRVDATVEAPLSVLAAVASGGGWFGHYLAGRLRCRGKIFKALGLLRAIRR